jgi:hypothetical protein
MRLCVLLLAASVLLVGFHFSASLFSRGGGGGGAAAAGAVFAAAARAGAPPGGAFPVAHCNATVPFSPRGGGAVAPLDPCALPAARAGAGAPPAGAAAAAALRSPADVARRARFAAACASLHPYSANISEGPPLEVRRAELVAHGARVHAALAAWLAPLRLPPPQHLTSLGYTGPFIEDMWASEFLTPVRYGDGGGDAPYDAELFHPLVPLFVPWERIFVADSIRAGAAAHKRLEQRAALQAQQLARLNATYARERASGGGGAAAAPAGSARPRRLPSPLAVPSPAHAPAAAAFPHLLALPADLLGALSRFLNATLRGDVAYVTVVQRPAGPWAEAHLAAMRRALARTVVLSSGGGGHVALPLLGRELPLLRVADAASPPPPPLPPRRDWPPLADTPAVRAAVEAAVEVPPPREAAAVLGFQGSARAGARARATAAAAAALGPAFAVNRSGVHPLEWAPPLVRARLAFAPRGVGATSFRLFEALQLGVPPVYVFDGPWPWLPYAHPAQLPPGEPLHARALPRLRDAYPAAALPPPPPPHAAPLWPALGYVLSEAAFNASLWARALPEAFGDGAAAEAAWRAKRAAIEAARGGHFTYAGVAARVREFLEDPWAAELFCARPVPPAWDAWLTPLPCCAAKQPLPAGNASGSGGSGGGNASCVPCKEGGARGPGPGGRFEKISEAMRAAREQLRKGVRVTGGGK